MNNSVIIYVLNDISIHVDVNVQNEDIWMIPKVMVCLNGTSKPKNKLSFK